MHSIIANGSIGKLVYPSLSTFTPKCKDVVLVSKIMEKDHAIDEFEIGQAIIKQVEQKESGDSLSDSFRFGVYGLHLNRLVTSAPITRSQQRKWNLRVQNSPDLVNIDPNAYLIDMEKADGDVHRMLERCRPTNLFAMLLALRNVVIGLPKMHDAGFYHFDIKPANLLYFGAVKNPHTVKICDFGLARHSSELDFWTAPALCIPWHNFPPWASYIALFVLKGSESDLAKKEQAIVSFFQRPESERFSCVDSSLYMCFQVDMEPFCRNPVLLFNAIDMYGLAMCLDRVFHLAPPRVQALISYFCTAAVLCSLNDDDVLCRWDEILNAF